jgi:phosphoglycerate dehydrogenase-like enzyme
LSELAKPWQAVPQMRIHIQNPVDDPLFLFTRAMWDAACLRAPDVSAGHEVTIGDSGADFADGIAKAEVVITEVGVVAAKFPCPAPRLKLLFITNAGLDRLAPYDWVPPGVTLLNNAGVHAVKAGEFAIMSVLMLAGRTLAEAVGLRAGQSSCDRRGARLAGRCGGNAGDAVRHAGHRRANDGKAASGVR